MKYMNRHVALKVSEIVLSFFCCFGIGNIARWVTVSQGWTRQFFYWVKSLKCLGWSSGRFRCKSVKAAALKLGLLFYAEDFSRFSAYKRHIFYAATRLNPHGLQIEYPGTPV